MPPFLKPLYTIPVNHTVVPLASDAALTPCHTISQNWTPCPFPGFQYPPRNRLPGTRPPGKSQGTTPGTFPGKTAAGPEFSGKFPMGTFPGE